MKNMLEELTIDLNKCKEVAKAIRSLTLRLDTFTDPNYYPPKNEDPDLVANYFFFMVAIDHRTGVQSKPFKGIIDGRTYEGSDLLYRLGMLKYKEDPEFFTTDRMRNVTTEEVTKWLSVRKPNYMTIRDPETRAMLLRDAAIKLEELYSGKALNIFKGKDVGLWLRRLSEFLAYSDPVAKKSFLLIKFLERRGLIPKVRDEELRVPVDNHLTRIAFRLGIVIPDEEIINYIRLGKEVSYYTDVFIRLIVREAYSIICVKAGIRPTYLDDLLWSLGRTCCTIDRPVCLYGCDRKECNTRNILGGCNKKCIFMDICSVAGSKKALEIREHTKINTWYY